MFDAESVGRSLGFEKTEIKNSKEYKSIRWNTINGYLGFGKKLWKEEKVKKGDLITEPQIYQLMFKASNKIAQKFQMWLAFEGLLLYKMC